MNKKEFTLDMVKKVLSNLSIKDKFFVSEAHLQTEFIREGDVTANFTKVDKAANEIGFKARYDINDMARDQWNWQKNNPNGYNKKNSKNSF